MPPFLHSIKKLYPLSGHLNFSNTTIFLSSTDFISIAFWQDYFFALLITIINQDIINMSHYKFSNCSDRVIV